MGLPEGGTSHQMCPHLGTGKVQLCKPGRKDLLLVWVNRGGE